jgi:hypothetical protein
LEPLDHVDFVGGQHFGEHVGLGDADLRGDGTGCSLVVAGQKVGA